MLRKERSNYLYTIYVKSNYISVTSCECMAHSLPMRTPYSPASCIAASETMPSIHTLELNF